MKYRNTESLGQALSQYLWEEGLETPLNEHRLISAWPMVVGEQIAKHTKKLNIYNQTLYVQIDSPVIRQEVMMQRSDFVEQLNKVVGTLLITNIMIR